MKLGNLIAKLELCSQSACVSCNSHNNENGKCSMICESGQTGVPRSLLEAAAKALKNYQRKLNGGEEEVQIIPMSAIRNLAKYRFPYGQVVEFRSFGGNQILVREDDMSASTDGGAVQ